MLTLATAHFIKVILNSPSKAEGEFFPTAMWFVAIILDFILFVLLVGAVGRFGG